MAPPQQRVMIVDDYPDAAMASSMLLSLLGYDCAIAHSGSEALERAAEFDPGVILLDIGLPDLSGYEVARALRARPLGHPLFIAAVTGWGHPNDRVQAFAAGCDHHVLKPTDLDTIKDILARATRLFEASP